MSARFLSCIAVIFMLLGGRAYAFACEQPVRPPSIQIEVQADQPTIDHQHSRLELKQFEIATVSPYGSDRNVHVNGLMRGAITMETNMAIAWQHSASGGDNCFWYDHITVTLKLMPVIYIAREIINGTCLYNEVLRHEYKHYDVDYVTAKDYQQLLQLELERFIRQTGVIGPYQIESRDQAKQALSTRLEQTIHATNDRLKAERLKRQALIDTREEYERVARACENTPGMY